MPSYETSIRLPSAIWVSIYIYLPKSLIYFFLACTCGGVFSCFSSRWIDSTFVYQEGLFLFSVNRIGMSVAYVWSWLDWNSCQVFRRSELIHATGTFTSSSWKTAPCSSLDGFFFKSDQRARLPFYIPQYLLVLINKITATTNSCEIFVVKGT